jgi:hypothetical protein
MANKLFELGFVLKAIDCLSGTLKKIETQMEAVNATAAAPLREFAGKLAMAGGAITAGAIAFPLKDAVEKAGKLEDHMARLTTAIGKVPDKARQLGEAEKFASEQPIATGYDVNQLSEPLNRGLSGVLKMTQAMAVSVAAAKLVRGTAGDLTGTTSSATLPVDGLSGETVRKGFLENLTQMSCAAKRLGFEVFAGPNRQAIDLLKTLQRIQRQFGDISKHKDVAAAFEKAAIAVAAIAAAPAIIASWGPVKSFFATLIPRAFEWRVNPLKTFAKGFASGVMWPGRDTSGAKRSEHTSGAQRDERASLRAAFGITGLRAAHIAMENAVTRMRSSLPFRPARVRPLRDRPDDAHLYLAATRGLGRPLETFAQAIQPVSMLAAIRRVAAVASVTMPMMIGGAAMPAAGAISSPAGAVVLNYAPHVEVHASGGDASTLERAVMEALEKNRREVYRMLEQVAGRRERTRFGG